LLQSGSTTMNNLRLIPDVYRLPLLIKANFSFGKDVSTILYNQKDGCWSQITRSWYFPKITKKRAFKKECIPKCEYTLERLLKEKMWLDNGPLILRGYWLFFYKTEKWIKIENTCG